MTWFDDLQPKENSKANNKEAIFVNGITSSHGSKNTNIPLLHFDDEFYSYSIQGLISSIENIRVNKTHTKVTIYFRSPGGVVNDMWTLIDYVERLEGLDLVFIVNGYICSAGFWSILLLSTLPHVDIKLGYSAAAMIHLSDIRLSVRDGYTDDLNQTNFMRERITKHNTDLLRIIQHIGLSTEQMEKVRSGQDLWLHRDQLSNILRDYYEWWFVDSETIVDRYRDVLHRLEDLKNKKKLYESTYLRVAGKKIMDVINPPSKKNKKEEK